MADLGTLNSKLVPPVSYGFIVKQNKNILAGATQSSLVGSTSMNYWVGAAKPYKHDGTRPSIYVIGYEGRSVTILAVTPAYRLLQSYAPSANATYKSIGNYGYPVKQVKNVVGYVSEPVKGGFPIKQVKNLLGSSTFINYVAINSSSFIGGSSTINVQAFINTFPLKKVSSLFCYTAELVKSGGVLKQPQNIFNAFVYNSLNTFPLKQVKNTVATSNTVSGKAIATGLYSVVEILVRKTGVTSRGVQLQLSHNASLIKVTSNGVPITSGFAIGGLKGAHVLKAAYSGRLLTLYVDGQSVYTYTDTRNAAPNVADNPGQVGFRLSKASLSYYKVGV